MKFSMSHSDFEHITDSGMSWKGIDWFLQEDRFEVINGKYDDPINFEFAHAYWLGEDYTHVILAREYLISQGFPNHQVIWDLCDNTAEWFLSELERLSLTAVGGAGVKRSRERTAALMALVERIRPKNYSYVILTDYVVPWQPMGLDTPQQSV